MNKKWLGVSAALLLGGCASVEMAQYTVTSFPEVVLEKRSKIKIVAANDEVATIVDAVNAEFKKNKDFTIVDEGADYWFVLNGAGQYLKGSPAKKVAIVKKESAGGGAETFAETTQNLASAAKGVSVAVYEVKTLTPVTYFEIPIYTGDNTETTVREESAFNDAFAEDVVERVKDAFLTQQKQVETPMPKEADGDLREFFAKGEAGYADFLKRYKELGAFDLAKLCERLRTKTYEGSDADMKLANRYLYLLVKESQTGSVSELRKIKDEQLMILEASDADGLAESVPVALARLEYKLANQDK